MMLSPSWICVSKSEERLRRAENARKYLAGRSTRDSTVVRNILFVRRTFGSIKELFQRIIDETTTFVNHLSAMWRQKSERVICSSGRSPWLMVWHGAVRLLWNKLHRNNKSVPTRLTILNTAQADWRKELTIVDCARVRRISSFENFVLSWHHRAKTEITLFHTIHSLEPYNLRDFIQQQWQALQKLEECGGLLSKFSTLFSCIIHFGRAPQHSHDSALVLLHLVSLKRLPHVIFVLFTLYSTDLLLTIQWHSHDSFLGILYSAWNVACRLPSPRRTEWQDSQKGTVVLSLAS